MTNSGNNAALDGIAIIGMAGRFPGARNIGEFWRNLLAGVESISRFEPNELESSVLEDASARDDPRYVPARGILDGVDLFDADFFGINPQGSADPRSAAAPVPRSCLGGARARGLRSRRSPAARSASSRG